MALGREATSEAGEADEVEADTAESNNRSPSFRATLTCSKLRMPSNPQRPIIALSSSQGEPNKRASGNVKQPFNLKSDVHGVVSICSPVKTALAPAIKHIACFVSSSVCRPAASLIIVLGRTIRAVAIVLRSIWYETGCDIMNQFNMMQAVHTLSYAYLVVF